jgi:hypothetical protein
LKDKSSVAKGPKYRPQITKGAEKICFTKFSPNHITLGSNFFASGGIFWLIWHKICEVSWQHCRTGKISSA